jgi:uncharacterized protein (TIGR03435 family)
MRDIMPRIGTAIFAIALAAPLWPQQKPAFEVASVKPAAPGERDGLAIQPGGRLVATNFTLKTLIAIAYHLPAFGLAGAEGWMANDRWSIVAKSDNGSDVPAWAPPYIPDVMAVRLQSLLEDRFLLKTHREKRDLKAYTLTVAKAGSKLAAGDPPSGKMRAGPGVIVASSATMDQIVTYLNRIMDMPVVDKTGLTGLYDINLKFAPESTHPLTAGPPADGSAAAPGDPTIFEALEQLGLNLRPAKEPIEVLVVDSAAKPTQN